MPGSPKKRARREAEERAQIAAMPAPERDGSESSTASQSAPSVPATAPAELPATIPTVEGELLTPVSPGVEPTRTALKRAMRARAQEHAAEAIAVLVENMRNQKLAPEKRESAANRLLEWGFGKPAQEIEAGDGAQMIVIRKFIED